MYTRSQSWLISSTAGGVKNTSAVEVECCNRERVVLLRTSVVNTGTPRMIRAWSRMTALSSAGRVNEGGRGLNLIKRVKC